VNHYLQLAGNLQPHSHTCGCGG